MKIILRGCDRERVKSKGRRKNKKSAKVTTNLKKNNRKIETEREELQESAKSYKKARNAIISKSFLSSALKKIFVGFVHLHSGTQS